MEKRPDSRRNKLPFMHRVLRSAHYLLDQVNAAVGDISRSATTNGYPEVAEVLSNPPEQNIDREIDIID